LLTVAGLRFLALSAIGVHTVCTCCYCNSCLQIFLGDEYDGRL